VALFSRARADGFLPFLGPAFRHRELAADYLLAVSVM
jgi:hypothetical protein